MPRHVFTIAGRVIRQIIRDRRTLALIIIVPLVIMSLIGLSFPEEDILDFIAPALLATMALFFSFLLTGISSLRERSQGTMERLMASPVSRAASSGFGTAPTSGHPCKPCAISRMPLIRRWNVRGCAFRATT